MTALVFLDTETTGLSLDDDIWEFAAIRRESDGHESHHHMFLHHDVDKCNRLPASFRTDHQARFPVSHDTGWHAETVSQAQAAEQIAALFHDRPQMIGAVPSFDAERLALLLRRHGFEPGWHYHLIDVENLIVGFLAGRASMGDLDAGLALPLPGDKWNSDVLSAAVGVNPAEHARHTALGDVIWVKAQYDAVMGT